MSYISRQAVIEKLTRTRPQQGADGSSERYRFLQWISDSNAINDLPSADVVEVVRCKDCKYYDYENDNCLDESGFGRTWKPTDYCSYGERRTDV